MIKTDQVGSCFVAYRAVHSVDRWKLHASWKKLGVVIFFSFIFTVVKKSCLEQKNARSRFALRLLNCTKFGQLILGKIIKIVATKMFYS